jgi:hypothetical protein
LVFYPGRRTWIKDVGCGEQMDVGERKWQVDGENYIMRTSRRIRWIEFVSGIGQMRNTYKV